MALGKWTSEKQKDLFIAAADMRRSPGHPFYVALNKLLAEAKFDAYVEGLCEPVYREGGRPSLPAVSGNSNGAKVPNADSNPGWVEESTGRASDEVAGCEGARGASSRFPGVMVDSR